jgi:predicted DNA-binding transcriptional regulator YafY
MPWTDKETKFNQYPYNIWFLNGTFYFTGHCHVKSDARIFPLDRIRMLHHTMDTFKVPKDFRFFNTGIVNDDISQPPDNL